MFFDLLKNLSKPGLSTASEYEKEFYKQNASLSTETSTGEEYVVTVADWGLLKTIYDDRFLPDPGKFGNEYNLLSDKYKSDHNSSEALATEYGLKGKLGNAINLYKKNPLTGKYEIVKLGQQVGATTGVLSKIGCPD